MAYHDIKETAGVFNNNNTQLEYFLWANISQVIDWRTLSTGILV